MDETSQKHDISAELTEEDKLIIMELVVSEMSSQMKTNLDCQKGEKNGGKVAFTNNQCEISPNVKSVIENTDQFDINILDFTKETRKQIIKQIINIFFQNKRKTDFTVKNANESKSKITLNDEEKKTLSLIANCKFGNETKYSPKITVEISKNNNKTEKQLDKSFKDNTSITIKKNLPVDDTLKTNERYRETTAIGSRFANRSVTPILELSSPEVDNENQIGLSSQEESEIKALIESIEKTYMNDGNNIEEKIPMRSTPGYGCSGITYSMRKINRSAENEEDATYKTENFAKSSIICDNKSSNKIIYSNGLVNNAYDKETTDCLMMDWEINDDELTLKTSEGMNDSHKKLVPVKEEHTHLRKRHKNKRNKSVHLLPMNDEEGVFYVDRELFPVFIYQQGLMFSNWNPTQTLYEICSRCLWPSPEFIQVDYTVFKGFLFGVKVKDVHFLPDKWGQTKKIATHLASSHFLNFIGFKFTYESNQTANTTSLNTKDLYNIYTKEGCKKKAGMKRESSEEEFLNLPVSCQSNNDNSAQNYEYNRHFTYSKRIKNIFDTEPRRKNSPELCKRTDRIHIRKSTSLKNTWQNTLVKSVNDETYPEYMKSPRKHCGCFACTNSPTRNYDERNHELKPSTTYKNYEHIKEHRHHREQLRLERNFNPQFVNKCQRQELPCTRFRYKPYHTDYRHNTSRHDKCKIINTVSSPHINNRSPSSSSSCNSCTSNPVKWLPEPLQMSKCRRIVQIREKLDHFQRQIPAVSRHFNSAAS